MLQSKLVARCTPLHIAVRRVAVDLSYKVHGEGGGGGEGRAPVVVLHGLLGNKRNWAGVCARLAERARRRVVAADARNHGASPHARAHAYAALAADVARLLPALRAPAAALLGHSMGGRTAMVLALTEPAKVESLIVVDVSPVSTPGILNDFFPRLLDVMKTIKFDGIDNISKGRALAKERLEAWGAADPGTVAFLVLNVGARPGRTVGWLCNVDVLRDQFHEIATFPKEMAGKQYKGPTLFIGGDQSNYIPAGDLAGIRQYFPRAELRAVAGAGHNVHADKPQEFLDIVTSFLT